MLRSGPKKGYGDIFIYIHHLREAVCDIYFNFGLLSIQNMVKTSIKTGVNWVLGVCWVCPVTCN